MRRKIMQIIQACELSGQSSGGVFTPNVASFQEFSVCVLTPSRGDLILLVDQLISNPLTQISDLILVAKYITLKIFDFAKYD